MATSQTRCIRWAKKRISHHRSYFRSEFYRTCIWGTMKRPRIRACWKSNLVFLIIYTIFRHGIKYIINVTANLPNYFQDDVDFHYLRIGVDDTCSHNLAQFFPDAITFIEKAHAENANILVHCYAGISRSVTICLGISFPRCVQVHSF